MSVLKNLGIDLPQSEKKSLIRFLSLYVFFTLVTLGLTVSLYYTLQKELAMSQRTIKLATYTNDIIATLENLKNDAPIPAILQDSQFHTSLYGQDYALIYSTSQTAPKILTEVKYNSNKTIRYVSNPTQHYRNSQYIVVEMQPNNAWHQQTLQTIIMYSCVFFVFMLLLGYYLVKLFLKPMKDALMLLNRFIKDTTHELNTPISTIMTNIELIDKGTMKDQTLLKIINRIDIGAKTISKIYDDLTYLLLHNKTISRDQNINLYTLLEQRIEYFNVLLLAKRISLQTHLDSNATLYIDPSKITRVIDNILSNAIKYNKIDGSILIELQTNKLLIKDTGKGIEQSNIDLMFDRYARFDTTVGGFGIGLNIVKMICDEYNLGIAIESEINKYTQITITF